MRTASKKILSLALAAVLAAGGMTVTPLTAQAAEIEMAGTNDWSWVTVNGTRDNTTKVYYAGGAQDGTTYQWYVVGLDGTGVASDPGTITLFAADNKMGSDVFEHNGTSNVYETSNLRTQLTSAWRYTNHFKEPEKSAMVARLLEGGSSNQGASGYDDNKVAGPAVTDNLWALSVNEANALNADLRMHSTYWWLRSPGYDNILAAVVTSNGGVNAGGNPVSSARAIRPAFQLNLESVLFASDAAGGKSATVGSLSAAEPPTGAVKFTMRDTSMATPSVTFAGTTDHTSTLRFGYSGAQTGENQYLSCVLEQSGAVKYYGKLADCETDGSGVFSLDTSGLGTDSYELKIFSEQVNGDNFTDFASASVNFSLSVSGGISEVSGGSPDNTQPAVSSVMPNSATEPVSGNIVITFSEPMNTAASVGTVSLGAGTVDNTNKEWLNGNLTCTIAYSGLAESTQYTMNISGFQDASGNEMNTVTSGYTFTTLTSDTTPPTIDSITPADNTTDVELSGNIEVTFDEPMSPSTGTVSLSGGNVSGGAWSNENKTYTIGYSNLAYSTEYTITVEDFEDAAGNTMTADSSHSFTTKAQPAGPDVSPPVLDLDLNGSATKTLTISLGQSGNQAAQASISVDAENQDDISITPATLTDDGTVTVTGLRTVSGAGITVTFSGRDLATPTNTSVAVNVTDSTPPPAMAHTVTLQNDGRGTGSASPNSATQGETITLTATPASGSYYFSHWEVVSGGAILSGNSFVMPDNDVTVKAHFSRYSSGGNDSSNDNTTPTVTITPAAQPDWPTIGSVSGKVTGTTAQRTFTITDSMVKATLETAQADAKAKNRTAYGIGAQIALDTPAAAGLTLTLERAALNRLVSTGAKRFELTGAPISLNFDAQALAQLQKQGTGNVTLTINPVTVNGVRNAYDITLNTVKDGKTVNITSIGTGSVTLSIPCAPDKNEAAGYLYAVYVDGNGKLNRIADSSYDANSGSVIFATNHFSVYGVGYTAPSTKFADIETHWGKESIDYVVGRGLLSGTAETTFAPDAAMTRGMLVTALGRLVGVDVKAYTTNSFTDVKADSAFRPYIEWAYKKGIVQGIGNQQFAPDRAITREEIAVIFANFAKATGYKLPITRTATTYADSPSIGGAYKTAVTAMQQAGIMMGGANNKFNPKSSATRAEVSAMLHRYLKLTIDPVTAQGWAKNDAGQWLYYKDGKALIGTQTIDGVKYFFETTGVLKTGWVKEVDNWRYYSGNKALTGWWDIGSGSAKKTYYFTKDGIMVSGKWLEIDGKRYYFYADGALARSTKVDGYEVDENGVRKTK